MCFLKQRVAPFIDEESTLSHLQTLKERSWPSEMEEDRGNGGAYHPQISQRSQDSTRPAVRRRERSQSCGYDLGWKGKRCAITSE